MNVPLRLLRYRARKRLASARRPVLAVEQENVRPAVAIDVEERAPEPIVSGRYFFPARPLLWVNRMPAVRVTSVNLHRGVCSAR